MPSVPSEVITEQYALKATFFANQLDVKGYVGLFDEANNILKQIGPTLNWSVSNDIGIKVEILKDIITQKREISLYFCHPNALISNQRLLIYYRCISALSQKGLKSISGVSSVDKIERGESTCDAEQAKKIASAINSNLSAIYSVSLPADEKIKGIMYATAGTTIDGSWRNAIGVEGERVFKSLLLKTTLNHSELKAVTDKKQQQFFSEHIDDDWIDLNTNELQTALFNNGSVAIFASEPDVTLLNPNGTVAAGIEIKAGIDPAGALERLGAMLKSFEQILLNEPKAETILVASCITDEVESRIRAMSGVSRTYVLTDIIQNNRNRGDQLMTVIRGLLGLVERRK